MTISAEQINDWGLVAGLVMTIGTPPLALRLIADLRQKSSAADTQSFSSYVEAVLLGLCATALAYVGPLMVFRESFTAHPPLQYGLMVGAALVLLAMTSAWFER